MNSRGFTLIELLISISLVVVISGATYFAMNGALDSWVFSSDRLSIQKVLSETMDRIMSGDARHYGLKDSLELVSAGRRSAEFVPPWTDDTHTVAGKDFVYTLNRRIRPGSPTPIAEVRLPESGRWRLVPVKVVEIENIDSTQVRLGLRSQEGSDLRFTYQPDAVAEPDAVTKIYWDPQSQHVFREDHREDDESDDQLSKNLFGVAITKFEIRYYGGGNQLITDRDWVDTLDLELVTGVEVTLEAKLGDQVQSLTRFINLRNAPMRTGYVTLREGSRIPIPDSKTVRTLLITNLSGIGNRDVLELQAVPRSGKVWRTRFEFERLGSRRPVIRQVDIEYPPQKTLHTELPQTDVDLGANLLLLGPGGLYDYDDDEDVDDAVLFEGEVDLVVTEMSIRGAGLFVRP